MLGELVILFVCFSGGQPKLKRVQLKVITFALQESQLHDNAVAELGAEGVRARKDKCPCISAVKWNRVFNSQSEFFIINKCCVCQIG